MVGMMLRTGPVEFRISGGICVTMDDANSRVYSAFCSEEGTSSFRAAEVINAHGLCSLYADRGSHYHTPEAGGKVDKENLTQVGRACSNSALN